jgi:hypothetical protein
MPIGFPLTPALNDEWPVASPIWRYDGTKWNAIAGTGVAGATPITDRLASLVATDDFIALRADVPYLVAASVVEAGPVAATAPAALTVGQWTAEATVTPGEIGINISTLPADGGSAITALEYRVGAGAAVALSGLATGLRVVTAGFSAGVSADIQVRAVNAVGAGAWSDTKTRTPLAGASAPSAFTAGQWTAAATATAGQISFDLTALPSNGGSAITALEYRVGAGAAIAFAGTGTGVRVVTAGLTAGVAVDLQVRAVNAVGAGAWSDIKNRTPLAGGGSAVAWGAAGTVYEGFNTTHTVPVVAGGAVGEMLLVLLHGGATISSINTNTSQALTLLATHSNGGITGRLYGVVISGSVPTSVSVVLGALDDLQAQTFFGEGVTAAGGIQTNGSSISAITAYPYTSTVAESLVFAFLAHPSALNIATATFNGADAAFSITKWTNPNYISTFTGKHDGTVGAQTIPVTWGGGASTDGRWMTVELVP